MGSTGPDPGKQVFGEEGAAGWDDYGFGQATVADGVKLIAGGLENVLQRFRLQARNITLRIELPPLEGEGGPPALVIVRLEDLTYAGQLAFFHSSPPHHILRTFLCECSMVIWLSEIQVQVRISSLQYQVFSTCSPSCHR